MVRLVRAYTVIMITLVWSTTWAQTADLMSPSAVKGSRYDVYMVGGPPGCSSATVTFRDNNVVTLSCLDGFGIYLPIFESFVAFFWAPNVYLGSDVCVSVSGITFDPFIWAAGVACTGCNVDECEPLVFTGFLLGPAGSAHGSTD